MLLSLSSWCVNGCHPEEPPQVFTYAGQIRSICRYEVIFNALYWTMASS